MNESFNKFFRSPEQDVKIRNQGSFSEEEALEIKSDFVNEVLRRYTELQRSSLSLKEELGEDIHEKVETLLTVASEYFTSLGFSDVKFDSFYLHPHEPSAELAGVSSRLDGTIVHNTDIDDTDIKQIQFLKTLSHELYHSTAAVSLTVKSSFPTPGHLQVDFDIEQGAGYRPSDKKEELRALEEGLASRFEALQFEKIKEWYPSESVEDYEHAVSHAYTRVNNDLNDPQDVTIDYLSHEYLHWGTNQYKASRELVNFLAERINDFDKLVEEMRLKRHSLPLARAIEAEFGEGAFRKITTAQDTEAQKLIKELSSK